MPDRYYVARKLGPGRWRVGEAINNEGDARRKYDAVVLGGDVTHKALLKNADGKKPEVLETDGLHKSRETVVGKRTTRLGGGL